MRSKAKSNTVRRSVALPRRLVQEASSLAGPELRHNWNRLVTVALQEFAARRRRLAFEQAMEQMAADPALRSECGAISREFRRADGDGL